MTAAAAAPRPTSALPPTAEGRLVDALAQLSFIIQLALTDVAAARDLSLTQLRMLGIVVDRTVAMNELASYLGVDRSSVSGLIERAERRGLVRREARAGDGRGVQVRITADGLMLAGELRAAITPRIAALTSPLNSDEKALMTGMIGSMINTA